MANIELAQKCERALQRLAKWRTVFVGWQLGTRLKGDPEADAVKDHRELSILLRAETTALTGLLLKKGLITPDEYQAALADEAEQLSADYAKRFPGVTATDTGLVMDPQVLNENGTFKGWKP